LQILILIASAPQNGVVEVVIDIHSKQMKMAVLRINQAAPNLKHGIMN
jgi:hypothetical protein